MARLWFTESLTSFTNTDETEVRTSVFVGVRIKKAPWRRFCSVTFHNLCMQNPPGKAAEEPLNSFKHSNCIHAVEFIQWIFCACVSE